MLIDDHAIRQAETSAHGDHAGAWCAPFVAESDHVFAEIGRAGARAGDVHATLVHEAQQRRDGCTAQCCRQLELIAAGKEHAGRIAEPFEPVGVIAVAASFETHRLHGRDPLSLKDALVERAHIRLVGGGRDNGDARRRAAAQFDEPIDNRGRHQLAADRNDPAAHRVAYGVFGSPTSENGVSVS